MKKKRLLDIFIDESGNFSLFNEENPLYSVAFVFVDSEDDNKSQMNKFRNNLNNLTGGNHFVHVGNLVRAEKPYQDLLREDRWKLFYNLFLFSTFAKYSVTVPTVVKSDRQENLYLSLSQSITNLIDEHISFFMSYDEIIIRYDFGQDVLSGIITSAFISKLPKCNVIKTSQSDSPFMQLADLYAYVELLKYKSYKGYLTKSESKFFGGLRNFKKNYLKSLTKKELK